LKLWYFSKQNAEASKSFTLKKIYIYIIWKNNIKDVMY
jgi:hypothetical protein